MLLSLEIKNYILIDHVKLNFHDQLNIITGETGAGKSMIFSALEYCLGKRMDTNIAKDKQKKTVLELEIDISKFNLEIYFEELELDYEPLLLIRREINNKAKSRSFINDTPCSLSILKTVSAMLVDLHKQFDNLEIQNLDFHRIVVDTFGQNASTLSKYESTYVAYKNLQTKLKSLLVESKRSLEERDFLQFRKNELLSANLQIGEKEKMESELNIWEQSEELKLDIKKSLEILESDQSSTLENVRTVKHKLAKFSGIELVDEVSEQLESVVNELDDLSRKLSSFSDTIEYDKNQLEIHKERLSVIYGLEKKYNCQGPEQLISILDEVTTKLSSLESSDNNIESLKAKIDEYEQQLLSIGKKLSKKRIAIKPKLEKAVSKYLNAIGLDNSIFKIQIDSSENFRASGLDEIEFMFSANADREVAPLRKVASGGEISRLMLCIKSVVSDKLILGTLVFDEIDTGISGEAALKTAKILSDLSKGHQIICITHSPQVASKAKRHFQVVKAVSKGITNSSVAVLDDNSKIVELAKMLSGDPPSKAAMKNAKELILS